MLARMDAVLRSTLDAYARRHGLSPTQRLLLEHAASGLHGPKLAGALGTTIGELATLERLFEGRTRRTLQRAVREIDAIIRQRSSHPPSRPVSGVAPRPGTKPRERTGTEDE